jgi:hypothetical protein
MGVPVSIFLVAVGAILAFAVNRHPNGVNVHAVGWILMAVGFVGLLLSLAWWERLGFGARQSAYPPTAYPEDDTTVYRRRWTPYPRRRTVVDEVDEAPPGPPLP